MRNRGPNWKAHEQAIARALGGEVQPGSGNGWAPSKKADVRTDRYLVQCKATAQKSVSIRQEIWQELKHQAHLAGKEPLIAARMNCPADPRGYLDLVAISLSHFMELTHTITRLQQELNRA